MLLDGRKSLMEKIVSKKADESFFKISDTVSVVSTYVRDFLINQGFEREKMIVNPNGVDVDEFNPSGCNMRKELGMNDNDIVIGMVSHFYSYKRPDLLVQVFQDICDELPDRRLKLLLVGSGSNELMDKLLVLSFKKHTDKIFFTGMVPRVKVKSYVETCDILVSPQGKIDGHGFFHGSPIKIFEYMAMQKPVLASRIGQLTEIINENRDGMLFTWNDADEMKRCLKKLILMSKDERDRLGRAAREKIVSMYTWESNVQRIMEKVKHV